MASIPPIPTEIWQIILRYVISVPVFLDPDGLASTSVGAVSKYHVYHSRSLWNCEAPYWEAERYRNACRRVCTSWNVYLQSVGHRFIKVRDIRHGYIPKSAIEKAIRVSVSIHRAGCELCLTTRNQTRGAPINQKWESAAEFFMTTIMSVGDIKTEIVTFGGELVGSHIVSRLAKYFPRIITFTSDNFIPNDEMHEVIHLLRQLRHLVLANYQQSPGKLTLDAPNLQTLSCQPCVLYGPTSFLPDSWNVPDLRSLHLTGGNIYSTRPFSTSVIAPLLQLTGSHLRQLHVAEQYLPFLSPELWDMCPNLESVAATSALKDLSGFYPLHTILIPSISAGFLKMRIPKRSSISRVVLDMPWALAGPQAPLHRWAKKCANGRIRMEDIYGVSIHKWLETVDQYEAYFDF